ncbi:MAG: selenocysteine-specific translation elongation factor [Gaiellaceae bacterium]
MPLTVGTAGHIDHGKTWLVRALTGKDTDRLPEEQKRGISIDLGYAPLELPNGRRLSLIDVPGHERFVRNMVAGATGIDLFLLVIDAAEGARPQTHEHLAILRLLGVTRGVVAVTKADAVDAETLELAVDEAQGLVPEAHVVAVSAKTGTGLDELRAALGEAAVDSERAAWPARLFVDRVFSLRGIGTVATGTLWSGRLAEGDELRVEPGGRTVRVRSVQIHDAPVDTADAGQRVAVALPGVERHELRRGDVLVEPGSFPLSYRVDVALNELEPIADGMRVNVHHGTSHTVARVVRADGFAQLRLAAPVVAARGDRVVLRTHTTVGGGTVLDPAPPRAVDVSRLEVLERGDPAEIVRAVVHAPVTGPELQARALLPPRELALGLAAVRSAGDWYFSEEWLRELKARVRRRLRERAEREPLDPGLSLGHLLLNTPWANAIAPLLELERRGGKVYLPGSAPSLGEREEDARRLEADVAANGFAKADDRELATFLETSGRLYRVGDGFAVSRELYERGAETIQTLAPITLSGFRDALGVSRRVAQLLLERYDADGLTRRVGDERVLRRAARR